MKNNGALGYALRIFASLLLVMAMFILQWPKEMDIKFIVGISIVIAAIIYVVYCVWVLSNRLHKANKVISELEKIVGKNKEQEIK